MNAVIDEDLPRSFGVMLSKHDFTVFDIRDHGLRGKSDDEIFQFAKKKKAILFSADLGFSNTMRYSLYPYCGICILRFPSTVSVETINRHVEFLLPRLHPDDYFNNLIIVSPGKIRVRRTRKPSQN